MTEISATDAARNFSDLLDAIEHDGEHYTIVRRGRAVAQLEPVNRGRGLDAKTLLRCLQPDRGWIGDVHEVRDRLDPPSGP